MQRLILQHRIGGVIQLLIQPNRKNGEPQLPDTNTGILIGDGIKQVILKIHLCRLKKHHFAGIRKAPDIRLFQLQERAGIRHQAAVSVLSAQGAGQGHRRDSTVPLAWCKLPDKLIPILQRHALRQVQAAPCQVGRRIDIVRRICHRQVI